MARVKLLNDSIIFQNAQATITTAAVTAAANATPAAVATLFHNLPNEADGGTIPTTSGSPYISGGVVKIVP